MPCLVLCFGRPYPAEPAASGPPISRGVVVEGPDGDLSQTRGSWVGFGPDPGGEYKIDILGGTSGLRLPGPSARAVWITHQNGTTWPGVPGLEAPGVPPEKEEETPESGFRKAVQSLISVGVVKCVERGRRQSVENPSKSDRV